MKNRKKLILLVAVTVIIAVGCLGLTACGLFESDPAPTPVVENKNVDMSGVTFVDQTFDYDGTEKSLLISGSLPEGVTGVTYTGNGKKEVGVHIVTASFNVNDGYNKPADMTAKLTISAINVTGDIVFEDAEYTYDGTAKELYVKAPFPKGISSVRYTINGKSGNTATDAGEYTVIAEFNMSEGYNQVDSVSAKLTINKADMDVSDVVMDDLAVKYDGKAHKLTLENLPSDDIVIEFSYKNNETQEVTITAPREVGKYTVTATLKGNKNYNASSETFSAVLTILDKKVIELVNKSTSTSMGSISVWYDNIKNTIEEIDKAVMSDNTKKYLLYVNSSNIAEVDDSIALNTNAFRSAFKNAGVLDNKTYVFVTILETVNIVYNEDNVGSVLGSAMLVVCDSGVNGETYISNWTLSEGYYIKVGNNYKKNPSDAEKKNLFVKAVNQDTDITAYMPSTVKFEANGGNIANIEYTTFETTYPSNFNTEFAPSKTGHTFGGWHTDIELNNIVTGETRVNNGATLYAKWTANEITVKYDGNGGATVEGTTVTYGNDLTVAAATTRTGYVFAGWNTAKNGSGTNYNAGATVAISVLSDKDAVTLYAQWTAITYTVKFDANGGTGTIAEITLTYDIPAKLTANTFVYAGREFIEWNTESDGSGAGYADAASVSNLAETQGASVILYAIWAAGSYSIEFVGGADVQGSMVTQKVSTDSTDAKISPNTFTKTGYTFAGWTKTQNGTEVEYADGATISEALAEKDQTVTLYAVWTENQYRIQFVNERSYATGTLPSEMTYKYTESKALTTMTFTISSGGYAFIGWTQSQDGSGKLYSDGETVSQLTAENDAVIKLYAQFKEAKINLEYVYNDGSAGNKNPTSVMHSADTVGVSDPTSTLEDYVFSGWTVYNGETVVIDGKTGAEFDRALKALATIVNDGKTMTLKANYKQKYIMYDNFISLVANENPIWNLPTELIMYNSGIRSSRPMTELYFEGVTFKGQINVPANYTKIEMQMTHEMYMTINIKNIANLDTFIISEAFGHTNTIIFAQEKSEVDAKNYDIQGCDLIYGGYYSTINNFEVIVYEKTKSVVLKKYVGLSVDVTIPAKFAILGDEYTVIEGVGIISSQTINGDNIESLTIEEGCKLLDIDELIDGTMSLKRLSLQEGVTKLPTKISLNKLEEISLPSTITTLTGNSIKTKSKYLIALNVNTIENGALDRTMQAIFTNVERANMTIGDNIGEIAKVFCKGEWAMVDGVPVPTKDGAPMNAVTVSFELNDGRVYDGKTNNITYSLPMQTTIWGCSIITESTWIEFWPKEGERTTFQGWYLDNGTFEQKWSYGDPIIENITLYAKFA